MCVKLRQFNTQLSFHTPFVLELFQTQYFDPFEISGEESNCKGVLKAEIKTSTALWVNDQLDAQLRYIMRLLLQSST